MSLRDENKEFISYRSEMKWSYIAFEKQIYRTNEVSISPEIVASKSYKRYGQCRECIYAFRGTDKSVPHQYGTLTTSYTDSRIVA